MEFDEMADTLLIDESERIDSKPLHHSEASRDTSIGHSPHEHMSSFRMQVLKVPEVVVGALALGHIPIWLWLDSMDY
jgi:hypothetical protein